MRRLQCQPLIIFLGLIIRGQEANFTKVLYMNERVKLLPIADVWNEYLTRQGLSEDWWDEVEKFETEVIAKRV